MTPLKIVIAGHVDHGKSTLIGRLLVDSGALPEGRLAAMQAACARRGLGAMEWSFLLDSFQAERDQAITIDTTQIRFRTPRREVIIIDAPGHREFLKNMISGASGADAAILVVDAMEGLQDQTRRHARILSLLGLRQMMVVVNKMDLVPNPAARLAELMGEIVDDLAEISLNPVAVIGVSARNGDHIDQVIQMLDQFEAAPVDDAAALRLVVQDVYRFDDCRVIAGRVESGVLRVGDRIMFAPLLQEARVESIDVWPAKASKTEAYSGECVAITIDRPLFVERGHCAGHAGNMPVLASRIETQVIWLSPMPMTIGMLLRMRVGMAETPVRIAAITLIDGADDIANGTVAKVDLDIQGMVALDPGRGDCSTGRFVLYHGADMVAGGMIAADRFVARHIQPVDHLVSRDDRAQMNRHRGGVFWLTGLSAAGKSTIAMRAERILHTQGYRVYVLDGDNVRQGLNADLGFSDADRSENIRRVGAVAALMADAGVICITAFISPFAADRARARAVCGDMPFHEIYIAASLKICESRDPKDLYRKARAGQINNFTGIDSPYESPTRPDLVIDTGAMEIDQAVDQLVRYVHEQVAQKAAQDLTRRAMAS